MYYFDKNKFYDFIHKAFSLETGMIEVWRAERVDPETNVYLFRYLRPFVRSDKDTSEFKGKEGFYIYCSVTDGPKEGLIKSLEDWYGQKAIEVMGTIQSEVVDDAVTGVLLRVPEPNYGY